VEHYLPQFAPVPLHSVSVSIPLQIICFHAHPTTTSTLHTSLRRHNSKSAALLLRHLSQDAISTPQHHEHSIPDEDEEEEEEAQAFTALSCNQTHPTIPGLYLRPVPERPRCPLLSAPSTNPAPWRTRRQRRREKDYNACARDLAQGHCRDLCPHICKYQVNLTYLLHFVEGLCLSIGMLINECISI
jgi:hypothetical protein